MAVLTESNWLEKKLKEELVNNNIIFEEQKPIYEKGNFFMPKYVVDFYLTNDGVDLVVECDGYSYHSSDRDKQHDKERDEWLRYQGYKNIVHFTSNQLRYSMDVVIKIIKNNLKLTAYKKEELVFKNANKKKQYIKNIENDNLHEVELFYQYISVGDKLYLVYKFRDNTLKKTSEERILNICDVPEKSAGELSLLLALKDLKKSVKLTVYCCSQWLTNYFNNKSKSNVETIFLKQISKILLQQNYKFKYLNTTRNSSYYFRPYDERLISQELISRCKQECYAKQTKEFVSITSLLLV